MTAHLRVVVALFVGLVVGALCLPESASAIEVKKKLFTAPGAGPAPAQGPAPKNPLTPALQQKLSEIVAAQSEIYLSQESEKKAEGKEYVDLEGAKFMYVPKMRGGSVNVEAKLEAPEYRGKKGDLDSKGAATGRRKALIFNYRLDGTRWVEVEPPKWQDVAQKDGEKKN